MSKPIKTNEELRRKIVATMRAEPPCEGVREFEVRLQERDALGVNWTVAILSGDADGKCQASIRAVVALLAKAYDLTE